MTALRLFKNSIFLNAALVGYVATVALFGAEFLMPLYLQSFRGLTALETGYVLLAVAVTSGIATPLAGRIYDRIGPRMNLVVGFSILCLNTWQLSQDRIDHAHLLYRLSAGPARAGSGPDAADILCGCLEQCAA